MIINHNIASLNTQRQLSTNTSNQSKNIEKLSSGLRINRAGDDAAGLAISEKMRGQIRGLDQASRNAQDGISLIQTAEGALSETHSILQRMRELAVQSANDTNTTSDRSEIQKEVNQLTSEIDRIGNSTEFNTKKLLNGSAGVAVVASNGTAANLTGTADTSAGTINLTAANLTLALAASKVDATSTGLANAGTALGAASALTVNGTSFSFAATDTVQNALDAFNNASATTGVNAKWAAGTGFTFTSTQEGSAASITTNAGTGMFAATTATTAAGADAVATNAELGGSFTASGNKITVTSGNFKGLEFTLTAKAAVDLTVGTNNALKMQIGANQDQNMSIGINDMRADALGVGSISVTSQATANTSVTTIQNAIEKVSAERSKLGAYQNRLDHTINNLNTSSENLTASESRIRDVDMAKEMSDQTKNSILAQAAQAMLAQANQQPQGVLQLLR
ncbi:flagellin domain-containing protein [Paenibacillus sp. FSL R7-277]|uniref:flagellin N-terminal helical domain-containing protein n=1 Tax=unclassified Paenibacillus TaxID=185978 RepID=UPI0003E1E4FF|nr:flagellin [Paenibacillus sp. FSL R7-277]ETT80095.1 flagellin domain-containing protein [Paenibacillus sp. FSL R7-277]